MSETINHGDGDPVDPFFIVGCVRSGTTLLRLLLGHHPSICKCEEFDFSVEFAEDKQPPPALSDFHYFLRNDRGFRLSGYSIDETLDYFSLMRSFIQQRQMRDRRPVVGVTVHSKFHKLVKIWPNSRFIYLRRDPRNVSRSIVREGWEGTAWHGTLFWKRAEASWNELKQTIAPEQWIEILYEDLIDNTTATLERVLAQLDLDYTPEMLEIEKDTTYKRPNPNEAQHWSKTASSEEIQLVEACAGAMLLDAGYERSSLPSLTIDGSTRLRLAIRNRYTKILFFVRKYGFQLWLLKITTSRLPFRNLRTAVQIRIDEVTNKHLK